MSLAINPETVEAVLLADGWHSVSPQTFVIDTYEYVDPDLDGVEGILLGGGRESMISARGVQFVDEDDFTRYVACPLSSVIAVRHYGR